MLSLNIQFQRENFTLNADFVLDNPVTGLFGASGSGKSTLLSLIAGLEHPKKGWIMLDEQYLFHRQKKINILPNKRQIGIVFQDSQLFPHLSVKQNLLFGYIRSKKNQRRFKLSEIVDLLEIGQLLKKTPSQLSGGEKQRVGLGRALLASPRLLLMDEPLAALDQGLKEQILPFLKRIKNELHLPVVYISHSMAEILHLTDHLVIIHDGQILGSGHFYEVLQKNQVRGVASNMGLENILTVSVIEHDNQSGQTIANLYGNKITLPLMEQISPGSHAYLSIRSNEIALAKHYIKDISIQNQIQGEILFISQKLACITVHVDIGFPLAIDITLKALTDLAFKQGDKVFCLIKAQSFALLGKSN